MKEPLSFYKANDGIKFYLVNCGSGLTHLIVFPDDTVMLFDCNLIDDAKHPNRNKDYILNFFKNVIPKKIDEYGNTFQPIDIFVNSHRDTDHLKGLKYQHHQINHFNVSEVLIYIVFVMLKNLLL